MPYRLKRLNQQRLLRLDPQADAGVEPYLEVYGQGSHTWTCPKTGIYEFAVWGPGGGGSGGGGAGLSIARRRIRRGETAALSIGRGGINAGDGSNASSTITLPDGTVLTGGRGEGSNLGGAGGTATGGDTNAAGSAASGSDGGAAGSSGSYRGGATSTSSSGGRGPGGGASSGSGADGQAIISRVA